MMNINKNSWHYELIRRYALSDWQAPPRDLCLYMNALVKALTILLIVAFLGGFIFILYSMGLMAVYCWIVYGLAPIDPMFSNAIVVFSVVNFAILAVLWVELRCYDKIKDGFKPKSNTQPGIFSAWYTSMKEKMCVTITYKD